MKRIIRALWDWSHTPVGDALIGGFLYAAAIIVLWGLCEILVCTIY